MEILIDAINVNEKLSSSCPTHFDGNCTAKTIVAVVIMCVGSMVVNAVAKAGFVEMHMRVNLNDI